MKRTLAAASLGALLFSTALAAQNGPPEPDFTITTAQRKEVIESSIARLNEKYVFPEVAKSMENSVRDRVAQGAYEKVTSAKELAGLLTEDSGR